MSGQAADCKNRRGRRRIAGVANNGATMVRRAGTADLPHPLERAAFGCSIFLTDGWAFASGPRSLACLGKGRWPCLVLFVSARELFFGRGFWLFLGGGCGAPYLGDNNGRGVDGRVLYHCI